MGRIEQRRAARFNVEVAAEVYTPSGVLSASTRTLSETGAGREDTTWRVDLGQHPQPQ